MLSIRIKKKEKKRKRERKLWKQLKCNWSLFSQHFSLLVIPKATKNLILLTFLETKVPIRKYCLQYNKGY